MVALKVFDMGRNGVENRNLDYGYTIVFRFESRDACENQADYGNLDTRICLRYTLASHEAHFALEADIAAIDRPIRIRGSDLSRTDE